MGWEKIMFSMFRFNISASVDYGLKSAYGKYFILFM